MKKLNKLIAAMLAGVMVVCAASCGNSTTPSNGNTSGSGSPDTPADPGETYVLRINSNMSEADLEQCADGVAITQMIEEVERESGGRLKMELYLNSQLGSGTDEVLGGAENGAFECFNLNAANWGSYTNAFVPLTLPYMFTSQDILEAYLNGKGGEDIQTQIANDTGMRVMFYAYMGYRTIVNNVRPITEPNDFKGVKMRVLSDNNILKAFELWGAPTVTVSYSELYTATQQGLIDGSDGPYTDITATNRNEVTKYISDINYSYHIGVWGISQTAYEDLPADLKEIFDTACEHAQETAADNASYNEAALSLLKETMTYNEITEDGIAKFKESVQPLYEDVKKELGEDIWNQILENVAAAEAEVGR